MVSCCLKTRQKKWDATASRLVNLKSNTMKNTVQIYSIERIVQEKRQKKYLSFQKNIQKVSFCKPHFALSNKRDVLYVFLL